MHATADGVALVFHDEHLARVTDGVGRIRDMRFGALRQVRLPGGEPIPRLDEVLGTWPALRLNVDVKHASALPAVVEVIRRTGALPRVCVNAFSDRTVARARRALGPGLCTGLGPAGATALRLASLVPALAGAGRPFLRAAAAQVPLRYGPVPICDRWFVECAHRLGLAVHVWTIDDESEMARLLDLGVDGIMTDRPEVLKKFLERKGLWIT